MTIQTGSTVGTTTVGANGEFILASSGGIIASGTVGLRLSGVNADVMILGEVIVENRDGVRFDASAAPSANHVTIGNTGRVVVSGPGAAAIRVEDGGADRILNHGFLSSGGTAVSLQTSDESFINTGVVSGGERGFALSGGTKTVVNDGIVTARFVGIEVAAESVVIRNSGDLIVDEVGVGFTEEGDGRVVNTGRIDADVGVAILGDGGTVTLVNRGEIDGAALAYNSAGARVDKVVNRGSMLGDVELGARADSYRAASGGTVEGEVSGGDGGDRLTGAGEDDSLSGDAGRDRLSGRGGDDSLDGGDGQDRIAGGRGDDMLTGGEGADRFVFGRQAGNDTVKDFEDGVDRLDVTAFGLDGASGAAAVEAALSAASRNATLLDLAKLGGEGSVTIQGLKFADAGADDFFI